MASPSCASSRTRSIIRRAIPEPLPLIECPYHPDETVVRLIADTPQNRGKVFYRCMKNARTPEACTFFKWKNKYIEYLVDGGFLEEPEEPMPAAVANTDDVRGTIVELTCAVGELKGAVSELQQAVGKRSTPFGAGEMIHMLLAVNLVVVVAFVVLALFK
ncbi:hypothetical protein EJB05_19233, partial [Eragrostis curvula]